LAEVGPTTSHRRIFAVVSRIPRGRVATYGQVAYLAELPGQARLVGYALNALPEGSRLPWQRVVNAKGEVSPRSDDSGHETLQRLMLKREGVRFSRRGTISLPEFQWRPR
jgi:methylated-DNA-protein-cysteine methyltransferase-like protein